MGEDLAAIFVPRDVGPRSALGHAHERDFVPQHVLVIEVRR